MNSEVAWALVSMGAQVQPQIILDLGYLPDYLSVSYDYDLYTLVFTSLLFLLSLHKILCNHCTKIEGLFFEDIQFYSQKGNNKNVKLFSC